MLENKGQLIESVRSGNRVLLGNGEEALVIKKTRNKGVFKDVYPWTLTMGNQTTGELIRESVNNQGVAFKKSNGSLSDYSISKVIK